MNPFRDFVGALNGFVGAMDAAAEDRRARIVVGEALRLEPDADARAVVWRQWMEGTRGISLPQETLFAARVFATLAKLNPRVAVALDDALARDFAGPDYALPPPFRTPAILAWSPADMTMWITHFLLSEKNKDRNEGGPAVDAALRSIAANTVRLFANRREAVREQPGIGAGATDPTLAIPFLLPVLQLTLDAVRASAVPLPSSVRKCEGARVLILRDPDPEDYLDTPAGPDAEADDSWWWGAAAAAIGGGAYVAQRYGGSR